MITKKVRKSYCVDSDMAKFWKFMDKTTNSLKKGSFNCGKS